MSMATDEVGEQGESDAASGNLMNGVRNPFLKASGMGLADRSDGLARFHE